MVTVFAADAVLIVGNVFRQSSLVLAPNLTLTRAIAMAGGVLRSSVRVMVRIHRRSSDGKQVEKIVVSLKQVMQGQAKDILLRAYDIVEVSDLEGNFERRIILPLGEPPVKLRHTTSA